MGKYKHDPNDPRLGNLFAQAGPRKEASLEKRVDKAVEEGSGSVVIAPLNDRLGYDVTRDTLRPFFSKVRRVGGSRLLSFEDHFNLARETYEGVYSGEAHNRGAFTGEYGTPHEILIHLTPSEIIALFREIGRIKSGQTRFVTQDERYARLIKEKSFVELLSRMVMNGRNRYNALSVMWRKENAGTQVPKIGDRLVIISEEGHENFYKMLSQPLRPARHPYRAAPGGREHVEAFYFMGIDTYIPRIIELFSELYNMKALRKV